MTLGIEADQTRLLSALTPENTIYTEKAKQHGAKNFVVLILKLQELCFQQANVEAYATRVYYVIATPSDELLNIAKAWFPVSKVVTMATAIAVSKAK